MEIRNAHFPGRAPLDAYGNGGFRFAEMSHRGSLLCVPSGIYGWNLTAPSDFSTEAFERVWEEQEDIEVLLIGTGVDLSPLPVVLRDKFREANILADPMSTGAAVRTFNVLLSENRAVAAALLAVD
ncbi:MAG: Mth938-like domain-containing protein [Roseibium sp.]|uniref:Mth938-like domain-containing protein n=1 Tax=Roseibium sp. TaxID=1936156 RepID=UPI00261AC796|nr:Mth938-like domain-containing protein [Roseibium sp.]MCV0425497.1 Mth938-like domain-containing protein [Roseibium sp.]